MMLLESRELSRYAKYCQGDNVPIYVKVFRHDIIKMLL